MTDKTKRKILKYLPISILGSLYGCKSQNKDVLKTNNTPKKIINFKMVTSFPRNLPGADLPAQKLAKK